VAASLKPVVDDYLAKLEERMREEGISGPIHIMKSNAGIMSAGAARRKPAEIIKSGPAGGIASSRFYGALLGEPNLITIDIGGTTADVGLVRDGQASVVHGEDLAWDIPVRVPMVDIKSIGAGGGSIAWRDRAGVLHVGPQSAGADPGPICYGRGGREPTVTDAAITAGLLDPDYFLGGTIPLDAEAARRSIRDTVAGHFGWSEMEAAAGLLQITVSNMAELVRELTINRGYDPRDFALMAFGGAGPLFAATLAAEVGLQRVYIPRDPGVFSAWGGLFSDIVHDYARSVSGLLGSLDLDGLRSLAEQMRGEAARDFAADGVSLDDPRAEFRYDLDLRYRGQSHELTVPVGSDLFTGPALPEVGERFVVLHEQFYGHSRPEDPIEVTTLRLRAAWLTEKISADRLRTPDLDDAGPVAKGERTAFFYGCGQIPAIPVFERSALPRRFSRLGPLIIEEPQSTTVVPPGHRLMVGGTGEMLITRDEERVGNGAGPHY
jgi:N-methylhydantoinase A/oxoprolinase/acetone carboxylase beta subunit